MANKYWSGEDTNNGADWTWDTSKADTIDNDVAVDAGGGQITIPITGTIFVAGDSVTIAGSGGYCDGTYDVESATTDSINITESYGAGKTFAGTETVTNARSNWKLCSDGSDTAKPAAADVIYFDNRAALNSTTNKRQSVTDNVDSTGTGTPDLAGLYVSPNYDGDIGSSTTYLEIEADGDDIIIGGSGSTYLKLSAGVGADADVGRLVVNNPAATAYIDSLENDGANVGLYASVLVFAGTCNIADGCAVTTVYCLSESATIVAGTGVTNAKTTTDVTIVQTSGSITWDSAFTSVSNYGGLFCWGSDGMTATAGLDGTLLTMYSTAGRFYWQTADTATSILKQFIAYAGTIDASRSINAGYPKEIGTGSELSEIWPNGVVNLNNDNRNITIAAGSDIECFGGKLTPPSGATIDW